MHFCGALLLTRCHPISILQAVSFYYNTWFVPAVGSNLIKSASKATVGGSSHVASDLIQLGEAQKFLLKIMTL